MTQRLGIGAFATVRLFGEDCTLVGGVNVHHAEIADSKFYLPTTPADSGAHLALIDVDAFGATSVNANPEPVIYNRPGS